MSASNPYIINEQGQDIKLVPTLHEIENGEGNGVVHWYCSPAHRATERADYGEVSPIFLTSEDVPEGTICETCGIELLKERGDTKK